MLRGLLLYVGIVFIMYLMGNPALSVRATAYVTYYIIGTNI